MWKILWIFQHLPCRLDELQRCSGHIAVFLVNGSYFPRCQRRVDLIEDNGIIGGISFYYGVGNKSDPQPLFCKTVGCIRMQ